MNQVLGKLRTAHATVWMFVFVAIAGSTFGEEVPKQYRPLKVPERLYRAIAVEANGKQIVGDEDFLSEDEERLSSGNPFLIDCARHASFQSSVRDGIQKVGHLSLRECLKLKIFQRRENDPVAYLGLNEVDDEPDLKRTRKDFPDRILQYVAGGPEPDKGYPKDSMFVGTTKNLEIAVSTVLGTAPPTLQKKGARILLYEIDGKKVQNSLIDAEQLLKDIVLGKYKGVQPTPSQASKLLKHYWPRDEVVHFGTIPPGTFKLIGTLECGPDTYSKTYEAVPNLKKFVAEYKKPKEVRYETKKTKLLPTAVIPAETDIVTNLKKYAAEK